MSLNEYEIEIDGHGHVMHVMALVEVWKGNHFGSSECLHPICNFTQI